jgi:hypothetical protein
MGDIESTANSTSSEHGDYFSEPGGYNTAFQVDPRANWAGKNLSARDEPWASNPLQNSWSGVSRAAEKGANNLWAREEKFNLSPLKEKIAS